MKQYLLAAILLMFVACSSPQIRTERHDYGAKQALGEIYQKGITARENNDAKTCLSTFHDLIELRKAVKDTLYVYALYQSGLCYEMQNNVERAIAVYQDAVRIKGVVPKEFYELEVPSRLAICYSKMGDQKVAESYYQKSKKYLTALQKDKKELNAHRERYAELLYEMGLITNDFEQGHDFTSYLKSIAYAQEYLTLALELNVQPYSKYAAQQLVDHFQSTYEYIAKQQPESTQGDEVLAIRENQERKRGLSETLLHHIDEFKLFLKTKRQTTNADYAPLLAEIDSLTGKLEAIIQERPAGEGLTPEAQKLQSTKINGHLIAVPGEEEPQASEPEKK